MESSPAPCIEALRHSHERLRGIVEPLSASELSGPSYPKEWSIAQVLSHLGSGAEIFGLNLEAGLAGTRPPGQEQMAPIWESWNAKSPQDQAADAVRADAALVERLESLDAAQLASLRIAMFGMDVDATMLARMRLGEHAVHTWDIAVALDPAATVAPDAVALLVDGLGQVAGWAGKPDGTERRIRVLTQDPERNFVLETADKVGLTESAGESGLPELRLPAEALIRLVYGRLDPAHTPATSGCDLDDLRPVFPGM